MKKVLFLITTLGGGGAEKVLSTISKNLDKSKYDITVMTINDTGVYIDEVKKYVTYKTCFKELKPGKNLYQKIYNYGYENIFKKFILKYPNIFYKIFIKEKYDIEIAFLENICAKIIGNSPNKKSKKYLWIHIDLEKSNWCKTQFNGIQDQTESYSKFDKIYCVSKDVKKSFNRLFGLNDKTFIQYNPNDDKEIVALSKEEFNEVTLSNRFKFITAGRFIEQKGYDRLLEVHKRLIEEGYNYELWILGDGVEKEKYIQFIQKHKLEKNTLLLGFQKNPYKFINKCDAYICTSRMEGYSLIVCEALILGIPMIATECAGTREQLNEGEYGLLVNNSTDGIYKGMKQILNDRELYNHYKKMSKLRSKDFILENVMSDIESILDLD